MNYPEGNFKMRFICEPNGKLLKGAPGNFECGKVYNIPFRHSKFKFWELIEEAPVLQIPEITEEDSVYTENVFLPPESDEEEEGLSMYTPSAPVDVNINISKDTPAQLSSSMNYLDEVAMTAPIVEEKEPEVEAEKEEDVELSRDDLIGILAAHGKEVKKGTRTTTLKKMIAELGTTE